MILRVKVGALTEFNEPASRKEFPTSHNVISARLLILVFPFDPDNLIKGL